MHKEIKLKLKTNLNHFLGRELRVYSLLTRHFRRYNKKHLIDQADDQFDFDIRLMINKKI